MQGGQIFVYGTLMADEVLKLLLKRVPPSKPATLAGHRRYAIRGQVFPAIVPAEPEASVRGKVLLQLTNKELEILDVYESEEYFRAKVAPAFDDGTTVDADVYIWRDTYRDQLLPEGWDYEQFLGRDLESYLEMTTEFMKEYFGSEPPPAASVVTE
ncbi:AIG2-like protein [Monoraphidium neglectum]|uniref:Putative gamma-glutamylcyclotransferase n=1 Tax=Monoraphidium neglectum TaxID=145388 RepID=A0A0D2KWC9_9CHLO|nr:AIG2-like protein [Monoraphidium neglectum]KIY99608.1 AIG2-like protein [Monoraphidium neglectum]|eukprot:XP_013898628.1 AIG2-like protein [Monoraphidium neglectum]